jgi:hypothetical protein
MKLLSGSRKEISFLATCLLIAVVGRKPNIKKNCLRLRNGIVRMVSCTYIIEYPGISTSPVTVCDLLVTKPAQNWIMFSGSYRLTRTATPFFNINNPYFVKIDSVYN